MSFEKFKVETVDLENENLGLDPEVQEVECELEMNEIAIYFPVDKNGQSITMVILKSGHEIALLIDYEEFKKIRRGGF